MYNCYANANAMPLVVVKKHDLILAKEKLLSYRKLNKMKKRNHVPTLGARCVN